MMGKNKVCVSSGEGFSFSLFLLFSCVFLVYLSESSFNMTSGGQDVEMEGLQKFLDTQRGRGGTLKKLLV